MACGFFFCHTRNMKKITSENIVFVGLIILAVVSRLVAHTWNFTAVMAASLAFPMLFKDAKIKALLLPMIAMLISDTVLGFHATMNFVYVGLVLAIFPVLFLKPNKGPVRIALVLVGSFIFFIISNLGVWLVDGLYPMTFNGLVNCYVAAIPFFKNQLLADLLITPVLVFAISKVQTTLFETSPGTARHSR